MTRQTILLVEDSGTIRKMLRQEFEFEQYAVVEAADAVSALAAVVASRPDLIVQDVTLPDADGLELTRWIRALPLGGDVPIILLTGFAGRLEEARRGPGRYAELLLKPVTPAQLIAAVRRHLAPLAGRPRSSGGGLRLLLVDDNPLQIKLDGLRFTHAGFEVTTAASGEEALLKVRDLSPHVVVSDILLAGMDGFELCQRLRRDPALGGIPVVLVSAHFDEERDRALAKSIGATALLLRDDAPRLLETVLQAVEDGAPAGQAQTPLLARADRSRRVIEQVDKQAARQLLLEDRCTRLSAELSLLGGVAGALNRSADVDLDSTLRDVFAAALDTAGISTGAIYLMASGASEISLQQSIGFTDQQGVADFFGHFGRLKGYLTGLPVTLPSSTVPYEVSREILGRANVSTLQVVPLVFDGEAVGALVLGANARALPEGLVAFARAIGAQIVQSLAFIRAFDQRRAAERLLRKANAELEEKVAARTRELSTANEALHRTVQLRQDMMAIVSHDLRNPLSIIGLAVAQLGRSERSAEAASPEAVETRQRSLTRLGRAAAQMQHLIGGLLDFASIEEGTFSVNRRELPVRELLDDVLEAHLPLTDARSLRLEVVGAIPEGHLSGDPARLLQIFSNLIGNAIKFTPANGRIALRVTEESGAWKLSIEDSGCGIAPDHLPHIFDRYWQAKAAGRHGVGLGLSIAKGIVEAHGGRLWVESVLSVGTTFHFTLPKTVAREAQPAALPISASRPVILVVDDDREIRELLGELLGAEGYRVLEASDGASALEILATATPHLILLDQQMPGMDGMAFLKERALLPALAKIPVVMISATCFELVPGVAALVRKPLEMDTLLGAVRRVHVE